MKPPIMHKRAPWRYEKLEKYEEVDEPTWECPDGTCMCHPTEPGEAFEFSVMLCEDNGKHMPFARCRVIMNGVESTNQDPHADAAGWMTVVVRRPIKTVVLEWAPNGQPSKPELPYRTRYFVELAEEGQTTTPDPREEPEPWRRRLHNLGFSAHATDEENVAEFERHYGLDVTEQLASAAPSLQDFHDNATLPISDGPSADAPEPAAHLGPQTHPRAHGLVAPNVFGQVGDGPRAGRRRRGRDQQGAHALSTPPLDLATGRPLSAAVAPEMLFELPHVPPEAVHKVSNGGVVIRGNDTLIVEWRPDHVECRHQKLKSPEPHPTKPGDTLGPFRFIHIHETNSGTIGSAIMRFTQKRDGPSAHYIVDRDGFVVKMALANVQAQHAGGTDGAAWFDLRSCSTKRKTPVAGG